MEECHVEAEAAEPFTAVVPNPLADVSAFFSFTSNVDAHHLQSFPAGEVHECHGNSETWQCATRGACDRTWAAPAGFRFDVDSTTQCWRGCEAGMLHNPQGSHARLLTMVEMHRTVAFKCRIDYEEM